MYHFDFESPTPRRTAATLLCPDSSLGPDVDPRVPGRVRAGPVAHGTCRGSCWAGAEGPTPTPTGPVWGSVGRGRGRGGEWGKRRKKGGRRRGRRRVGGGVRRFPRRLRLDLSFLLYLRHYPSHPRPHPLHYAFTVHRPDTSPTTSSTIPHFALPNPPLYYLPHYSPTAPPRSCPSGAPPVPQPRPDQCHRGSRVSPSSVTPTPGIEREVTLQEPRTPTDPTRVRRRAVETERDPEVGRWTETLVLATIGQGSCRGQGIYQWGYSGGSETQLCLWGSSGIDGDRL